MAYKLVLFAMSVTLAAGQRPGFAGSRPIGYPEYNRTTTTVGLNDRFGEDDVTTQRLPIEAKGDRELVDRLSKLPIDKQPFWFINWQAIEANRNNPQTYPQKPNVFIDPIPNTGTANSGSNNQVSNSNTANSNSVSSIPNTGTANSGSNNGVPNSNSANSNSVSSIPKTVTSNSDSNNQISNSNSANRNSELSVKSSTTGSNQGGNTETLNSGLQNRFSETDTKLNIPSTANSNQDISNVRIENLSSTTESVPIQNVHLPTHNHFRPKWLTTTFRPRTPVIDN